MTPWRPQAFRRAALELGRSDEAVNNSIETIRLLHQQTPDAQPILTLRHLGHLTDTPYEDIRNLVTRVDPEPYRDFRVQKRSLPGEAVRFRRIAVPAPWLMALQRWINLNVLQHVEPHEASVAYSTGNSVLSAASIHCKCRWLIKVDIKNFFESITEAQVFRVFKGIGYQPLIAFELARICTRIGRRETRSSHRRFAVDSVRYVAIPMYRSRIMGHLPQGAPTSPRIANLVAVALDRELAQIAEENGLAYTRYADDLIFSTSRDNLTRPDISRIIGSIYKAIANNGFTPNTAKTIVSPPGSRKVVLGLLVDRGRPRLTREFRANIRKHIHYLRHKAFGPATHAARNGNATIYGLRRHVLGLIHYARQIDRKYGEARLSEFNLVIW